MPDTPNETISPLEFVARVQSLEEDSFTVVFTKKNGEIRIMTAQPLDRLKPEIPEATVKRLLEDQRNKILTVMDIQNIGPRRISLENLLYVNFDGVTFNIG